MAFIYQRNDKYYISYAGPDGKQIQKSLRTTNKNIAQEKLNEIRHNLDRGYLNLPVIGKRASLDTCIKNYLVLCEANHAESTLWIDQNALKLFLAFSEGKIDGINQITINHLEAYKLHRKPLAAPGTVNRELNIIKAFLNRMVSEGLIPRSPCMDAAGKNLLKPLQEHQKKVRFLSVEELQRLLSAADDRWRSIITFAVNTGIRRAELQNLTWKSVDLQRADLVVESGEEFSTKNYRIRHIPLNRYCMEVLNSLPRHKYVFGTDRPFVAHFNHRYNEFRDKAGLRDTNFHTLRHTFASHLAMNGTPINTIQYLMGHSNIQTTLIYLHFSQGHSRGATESLKFLEQS